MDDDLEYVLTWLLIWGGFALIPLTMMVNAGCPWAFELAVADVIGTALVTVAAVLRGIWLEIRESRDRRRRR